MGKTSPAMEPLAEDLRPLFHELRPFKKPPLHRWHPQTVVDIDIAVDGAGNWLYRGSGFKRHALVKLFATVLRREADEYFLVTPEVQYRIQVADAPFLAVDMEVRDPGPGQQLYFRTNMDEVILADAAHPLYITAGIPYLMVRAELCAKLVRPVYYRLAALAVERPGGYRVLSAGTEFILG